VIIFQTPGKKISAEEWSHLIELMPLNLRLMILSMPAISAENDTLLLELLKSSRDLFFAFFGNVKETKPGSFAFTPEADLKNEAIRVAYEAVMALGDKDLIDIYNGCPSALGQLFKEKEICGVGNLWVNIENKVELELLKRISDSANKNIGKESFQKKSISHNQYDEALKNLDNLINTSGEHKDAIITANAGEWLQNIIYVIIFQTPGKEISAKEWSHLIEPMSLDLRLKIFNTPMASSGKDTILRELLKSRRGLFFSFFGTVEETEEHFFNFTPNADPDDGDIRVAYKAVMALDDKDLIDIYANCPDFLKGLFAERAIDDMGDLWVSIENKAKKATLEAEAEVKKELALLKRISDSANKNIDEESFQKKSISYNQYNEALKELDVLIGSKGLVDISHAWEMLQNIIYVIIFQTPGKKISAEEWSRLIEPMSLDLRLKIFNTPMASSGKDTILLELLKSRRKLFFSFFGNVVDTKPGSFAFTATTGLSNDVIRVAYEAVMALDDKDLIDIYNGCLSALGQLFKEKEGDLWVSIEDKVGRAKKGGEGGGKI
jgi:flagellar motility protein MotE (MotC chaperone)